MSVQLLLCRGRARGIEDALQLWPLDGDRLSGDRDALLRECEGLVEACERLTRDARKRLVSGAAISIHAAGDGILAVLDQTLAALRQVGRALAASNGDGVVAHLTRAERLRDNFAQSWPFADDGQIAASLEELARGEGQSLESWLNELR